MGNSLVESQLKIANDTLTEICGRVSCYLNEVTITNMLEEETQGDREYFKSLLSTLRRVLVFCEEGMETSGVILQGKTFRKSAAEKTMYWIYHNCVEEFFNPRLDNWYEDSRSAYTGKNAIKFSKEVPTSLKELIQSVEGLFQLIREELEYYETDYRTKMTQTK